MPLFLTCSTGKIPAFIFQRRLRQASEKCETSCISELQCRHKMPQTGCLRQQKFTAVEARSTRSGCQHSWVLASRNSSWLTDSHPLPVSLPGRKRTRSSSFRPRLWPHLTLTTRWRPWLYIVTRRVKASIYELGEGRHNLAHSSRAMRKAKNSARFQNSKLYSTFDSNN